MEIEEKLRFEDLEAFALGRLSAEDLIGRLLAQLEAESPRHRRMIRRWRKRYPEGERPSVRLLRRLDVLREIHPGTLREAKERLEELWRLPAEKRIDAALDLARRWNHRLLVLAALDRVRDCFPGRVDAVDEEIEVAHSLIMSLGASTPQAPSWRASAHVRLLTYRAIRLKLQGRLREAQRLVDGALTLSRKVDDRRTLALLEECQGGLLLYFGRPAEAADRLAKAADLYAGTNDVPSRSRTLLQMAQALRLEASPDLALTSLQQAVSLLDPEQEPYLYLCCEMTRCEVLCDLGEPESAAALLDQHRDLVARFQGMPRVPHRLEALEGRIALGSGDPEGALRRFRSSRSLALQHGLLLHAAYVSLDIALVLLQIGDTTALREEVRAITPILAAEGLQREPATALSLYRDALLSERLTERLAHRFQTYFGFALYNPATPFRRRKET